MARQSYSKEFKARVAVDAFKGQKTVSEIASEHKVHPNQVRDWKKRALADPEGCMNNNMCGIMSTP